MYIYMRLNIVSIIFKLSTFILLFGFTPLFFDTSLTAERCGGGFPAIRPAAEETEKSLKNAQATRSFGLSATVQLVKVGQALSGIVRFQIRLTAKCYSAATHA